LEKGGVCLAILCADRCGDVSLGAQLSRDQDGAGRSRSVHLSLDAERLLRGDRFRPDHAPAGTRHAAARHDSVLGECGTPQPDVHFFLSRCDHHDCRPLFFTALAAWFIPAERFGLRAVGGFAVAFGGIVVLFAEKLGTGGASSLLGDGLVIISAICWATQSLYLRMKLQGVDPFRITAWSQLVAVPIFLLFAFFRGAELPDMTNPVVLLSVGFNGFVGTGLVMVLWVVLLSSYPPRRVSAFMFLTPVFGVFLSGLILLEPMSAFMLAGAALVAAGIYLVNTDRRRAS
jgi:uncharacterized membrane protein